jgi:antitoxin (DNA-binding transcriptional repressor) of toxin-antitoxin stability system
MEASVIDLRYKMKDVLEALERREAVKILYHGKVKGTIVPASGSQKTRMADHPFFGMRRDEEESVPQLIDRLRKGRYDAL